MRNQGARQQAPAGWFNLRIAAALGICVVTALVWLNWPKIRALAWYWQVGIGCLVLGILVRFILMMTRRGYEEAQVQFARMMFQTGRYDEALRQLEMALKRNPSNSEARYFRGQCLDRLGRTVEADAAWDTALEHNSSHPGAAHNLACDYMDRGEFLTAAKYMGMARTSGAASVEPLAFQKNVRRLRDVLIRKGVEVARREDPQVLEYADAVVDLDPTFALGFAWRAEQRVNLGLYQEAIDDANTSLRLDPSYTKVRRVIEVAEEGLNQEVAEKSLGQAPVPSAALGPSVASPTGERGLGARGTIPYSTSDEASSGELSPSELPPGSILWHKGEKAFDRIRIRKVIVKGGMGTIYCGWDEQSNTPMALKSIRLGENQERAARLEKGFRREAEHWFRLGKHPRIVTLYSVAKVDHRYLVLVMEYIAGVPDTGPTLWHHLARKKQPPVEEALRIAIGITAAMQYAHQKSRLVHRDLKPQNVFLTVSGYVKVGDFGLAVPAGTRTGPFLGTHGYAPQEQYDENATVAPTMDVYAIGVILCEMLFGEDCRNAHPNAKAAVCEELLRTQSTADRPNVSRGLRRLILRCLSSDPVDRPGDYAELKTLLLSLAGKRYEEVESATEDQAEHPGAVAYNNGVSADSLGYLEEALGCFEEAVQHEPFKSEQSEAWANLAKVLGELRRFQDSVRAAKRALEIDPDDLPALQCLATSLSLMGLYPEAIEAFDRLVAKAPDQPDAHSSRGWVLLQSGNVEAAMDAYLHAQDLDSNHRYAWSGLGLCAKAAGDLDAALAMFDRAIKLYDGFADAHYGRAEVLAALGRESDALEAHRQAARHDPNNPEFVANLGIILANLGEFGEALAPLQRAAELDPQNGIVCLALARVCGELGRYPEAIRWGKRAKELGHPEGGQVADQARHLARDSGP